MIAPSYYTWTASHMTPQTVQLLNTLNLNFYKAVAAPFSESRNTAWSGWDQLKPYIATLLEKNEPISVLDLGCGNGRFGQFLANNFSSLKIAYTGVDVSESLLADADSLHACQFQSLQLIKVNLIDELIDCPDTWLDQKWDLVVAFGLIHHIPSQELRQSLIKLSLDSLNNHGLFALAAWQFTNSPRLVAKQIPPSTVGISTAHLDPNDFILSWDRGTTAYRYCHLVDETEMNHLLPKNAQKVADFLADGKENNLNHYLVLSR